MKCARVLLLLLAGLSGAAAHAQESAAIEAEKLLDTMNVGAALDQTIALSMDAQLKANPKLVPYRQIMLDYFARYASYAALKPAMIEIYASEFSASELKQVREFYSTPAGRKVIERLPVLMARGAELGGKAVQEYMGELQQLLEAESKRLENQEQAPAPAPAQPDAPKDPKASGASPA